MAATKRTGKRLPVVLNVEEVDRLTATVSTKSTTGLRNRAMLAAMIGGGLRVSEVCNLRGADVDLGRGLLRVKSGKGDVDRTVPVNGEALPWLQAWSERRAGLGLNGRGLFFVGLRTGTTGRGTRAAGEGLKPRYIQQLVSRLAEAAGIDKRVTPHVLRHTFATKRLHQGLSLRDVQTLLGHSNVSTTQVYTHVDEEELARKVQALDGLPTEPDAETLKLARALQALPAEQKTALLEALQAQ